MGAHRRERRSDSPLVERIVEVCYDDETRELSTPDGCWDIVVLRKGADIQVLQTGLITAPVELHNQAGDSYLCISFKPGVFMPRLPGERTLNRGLLHPLASPRSFVLDGEQLEIPTFENAEGLVGRLLQQHGLARDEIVEGIVEGTPRAATPRSVQRHFLRALGTTAKQLAQIRRACQAVELLQQARPAAEVALTLGYADQAHLARSLRRFMGKTPRELVSKTACSTPRARLGAR